MVDIAVKLIDGPITVDSSIWRSAPPAHRTPKDCRSQPVLLGPIHQVEIVLPSEATAKMNALMSGRRADPRFRHARRLGRLGRGARAVRPDRDLIVEIRSATAGVGSYTFRFDHMAELTGRTADQIVAARKAAAAA